MNWQQIHVSSTPEERIEALTLMLRVLEARHNRRVFLRGRLILERRRTQAAHWIADRRGRYPWSRVIIPFTFLFILLTVSTATGLFVLNAPTEYAAPVLFFYLTSLWAVLAFKPKNKYQLSES
jgi:hypothetical protein